jgi:hypothetical protein
MNTLAIIPVHGRHNVCKITAANCNALGIDTLAICSVEDYPFMYNTFTYAVTSQLMFPHKIDDGLTWAKKLMKYDNILMIGCDDIISEATYKLMIAELEKGKKVVAINSCYILDSITMYVAKWPGYPVGHHRHGEPCGAFRLYDRSILDAIGWKMYDCNESTMDSHSWNIVVNAAGINSCVILHSHYDYDIKDNDSMTKITAFDYLQPISTTERMYIVNCYNKLIDKVINNKTK